MTDSTWSLPGTLAHRLGIAVLPLHVSAGTRSFLDLEENAAQIAAMLVGPGPVSTSQPNAAEVASFLGTLAAGGAREILCIHLSAELSGTFATVSAAARQLAGQSGAEITVVDSRTAGAALGYAAAVAAATLRDGGTMAQAEARARRCAGAASVHLAVADLGHLRRGGRLKMGQATLGTALGIRPVLELAEGGIRVVGSVRGARRAQRELVSRTLAAAAGWAEPVSLAVHHTEAAAQAAELAGAVRAGAADAGLQVDRMDVTRMSGVLAAHAGPGSLAVVAAPTGGLLHSG